MLIIHESGMQTTIQDLGRAGFQKYGMVESGAMDTYACRMANLLVGNEENAATLEVTLKGPTIQFNESHLIAICGGDLTPQVDQVPVKGWRPIFVSKGQTLTFGKLQSGCRCYIAIAGGIDVPEMMNSRSTYLRAALGGYRGRALKPGDRLATRKVDAGQQVKLQETNWFVQPPPYSAEPVIRVTPGRQFEWFDETSRKSFFSDPFSVSSKSDRMGYRLQSSFLSLAEEQEMISEAVAFGSIQVPADGHPIVLMADRPTTGGYPKIADVITVDLPLLSQLKPGDRLRFKPVEIREAHDLLRQLEKKINCLKRSIQMRKEENR